MSKYIIVPASWRIVPGWKFAQAKDGTLYDVSDRTAHTSQQSAIMARRTMAKKMSLPEDYFAIHRAKGVLTYEVGDKVL